MTGGGGDRPVRAKNYGPRGERGKQIRQNIFYSHLFFGFLFLPANKKKSGSGRTPYFVAGWTLPTPVPGKAKLIRLTNAPT